MSSPPSAALRVSPELRAAIYHFAVFGSTGVASVYFGIWLTNRGISPDEIGIINAAPLLLMLLVNQLVGRIADRMPDWRGVIIVLSLVAGAVPIALFFVSGFWGVLLVWTLSVMPAFALVPVVDAATLRMTQRRGTDFSAVRAWGTVGFMVTTGASGPLIAWLGDAAFVPIFVAFALLRALLSFQLPQFRAGEADRKPVARGARRLREVLKPWFLLTLLGVATLYASHGVLGAFGALLWHEQGIAEGLIGPLVATMAAAEAAMMFVWGRLKLKVSARHIILFACIVAAFRWTAMAFSPPVWVLFGLQMLHSVTFAMGYLGGIYFLANWTSEDIAAEAQGFSYVLQQAMSVLVIVGMGWFVAVYGTLAWLFVAGFAVIGALCVLASLRLQPKSSHPVTTDQLVVADPAP
ncbi:MFS transporter [Devosia sp. CN2-171]|jgi:PPP family 3-phenylpropionic acid transporter|uniref:MFS transporter n=1 Tax=Devosia sp. CN2-171 TaxID=3400909 RepID=UPI003BF7F3D3